MIINGGTDDPGYVRNTVQALLIKSLQIKLSIYQEFQLHKQEAKQIKVSRGMFITNIPHPNHRFSLVCV